jgi:hypothetical protein
MTSGFSPPASEAAARAIIPLAHQVCDARAQGQSDLQAAHTVLAGKGLDTLGVPSGSVIGAEKTAPDIVNAATLAYCPKYNKSNWCNANERHRYRTCSGRNYHAFDNHHQQATPLRQ